jgi:hypothetical protein
MELLKIKVVPMKHVSSLFKLEKKRYNNIMLELEYNKNPLLTEYMKVNSSYRWLVQRYCSKFIGSLQDFFQGGWTPMQLKIFCN